MGSGLGVDVVRDPVAAGVGVSAGSFGWAGAFGTRMWVDPMERMVTILLVSTRVVQVRRDFEYAVRPRSSSEVATIVSFQRTAVSCQRCLPWQSR
jgi:CubicO group peptidase (beta-lactamase class C family)